MASQSSPTAYGSKKVQPRGDSSLPDLLSADALPIRRGSIGAAWPSSRSKSSHCSSMSDALLLVADTSRPRSSSYTAAAANGDQQADPGHGNRKDSCTKHEIDPLCTGGSHAADDVVDGRNFSADPSRLKADVDLLKNKVLSTVHRIQQEQTANEEKVTWYLNQSEVAPSNRAKAAFEKHNQKAASTISHLKKKLESYRHRLREAEKRLSVAGAAAPVTGSCASAAAAQLPAASHGHGGPKGLLRDVGSGLREIRDGVLGSLAVVPYDIRRGVKKMFGSADNLHHLTKNDPAEKIAATRSVAGSGSGPGSTVSNSASKQVFRRTAAGRDSSAAHSDDDNDHERVSSCEGLVEDRSDADSPLHKSASSGNQLFLHHHRHNGAAGESLAPSEKVQERLDSASSEIVQLKRRLAELQDEVLPLQERFQEDRCLRLEEQLNDVSDLYNTELANLKQELANAREKLEYEMEERTRDLQEYIESCHTKISKMELQGQRQQQVLSMEGMSNATLRVLATKFANVVLALVAVLLLIASAATKIVRPFVSSGRSLAGMLVIVAALALASSYWHQLVRTPDDSATASNNGSAGN